MNILVSLINYNSKEYLLNCLENIYKQKTTNRFSVVVFDNNSPDNSADEIKKAYPKIELIKHDKNIGFGKGHTLVAEKMLKDFDAILLVNPDTTFAEDTFEKLADFMTKEDADMVSGKIKKPDGTLDSNGGNFPFGLSLLSWLFNLELLGVKENFHRTEKEYYQKEKEVDWIGGTFMLVKKEVINKIGFFDKDYFMYFEDVEFCYRAKKSGFKIMLTPNVVIEHASGGSTDNPRYFQWSSEFKNLLLFYKKNFGLLSSFLVKILLYISIVLRICLFGLLGKTKIASTYGKVLVSI